MTSCLALSSCINTAHGRRGRMIMAKKIWNDEDNYKLIQRVEENVILWDARKEEYKCSERKPAIWRKLGEEFESDSCNVSCIWFCITRVASCCSVNQVHY
jgi:hypothetical protein